MAVNFSEEEIKKMYSLYEKMLEDIRKQTETLSENMISWAKKVHYEPAVKLAKEIVGFYNNDIRQAVKKSIQDWKDSDDSFEALLNRLKAGESAKKTGRKMEEKIIEDVNTWKEVDGSQLAHIDTANPVCKKEDIEKARDYLDKYKKNMRELRDSCTRKVQNKQEENSMYVAIEPVVLTTAQLIFKGFDKAKTSVTEMAADFEKMERGIRGAAGEAARSMSRKSEQESQESFNALKKRVKKIIE